MLVVRGSLPPGAGTVCGVQLVPFHFSTNGTVDPMVVPTAKHTGPVALQATPSKKPFVAPPGGGTDCTVQAGAASALPTLQPAITAAATTTDKLRTPER